MTTVNAIDRNARQYGPGSTNRLAEAAQPGAEGARAALETFYFAFNNRDSEALRQDWADHPLVQLNNPLGGIIHGRDAIGALYERVFHGPLQVEVSFGDIVEYIDDHHAVFAGRETGSYRLRGGAHVPLAIRTTRYFRYQDGSWRQYHHHGSIDDPQALRAYRDALAS
jgi:ketosteroid isomerase-like protein